MSNFMKMAEVFKTGRKHSWNSIQAISHFPTVFSKDLYCRHVKTRACLGKGERQRFSFGSNHAIYDGEEIMSGNGENACYHHFLHFQQSFPKIYYLCQKKIRIL